MNHKFRKAKREDVGEIIRLLSEDILGENREQYSEQIPQSYYDAFEEIDADPNNELIVCEVEGKIVGTLQLTFMPSLTHQGAKRMQIEGVRVDKPYRSQGIGKNMFEWAIARARQMNCRFVQLTTNKNRSEAHQFYFNLGFVDTHVGMKLDLAKAETPS